MKAKIMNIANRSMPVDGTEITLKPGQECETSITQRIKYLINNKFFKVVKKVAKPLKTNPFKETKADQKPTEEDK